MNATLKGWIEKAIEDAKNQPWFSLLKEMQVRDDLEEWGEDGMLRTEKEVRDRLCQFAQQQIKQIGKANFRCTI